MFEVTLRPITLSDTDDIIRWRNSDAVRKNMQDKRLLSAQQHRNYYYSKIKGNIVIQDVILADTIKIGTIYIKKKDTNAAELGIFIGEEDYRNQGIGTIAINKFLDYIKNNTSYRLIYLKVKRDNFAAIQLYKKIGFTINKLKESHNFLRMELFL